MKKLKISSIFHWLYCSLLLAPCFAVATACVQTAFHGSEISEVPPEFGRLEDGKNDFKENLWYVVGDASQDMARPSILADRVDIFMAFVDSADSSYYAWSFECLNSIFSFGCDEEHFLSYNFEDNFMPYFALQQSVSFADVSSNMVFAFRLNGIRQIDYGNSTYIWYWRTMPQEYLSYMPKDYTSGVSDVFYTSVDKVASSPLFNWAEKSFLGDGFRYAGNWFGLPVDSPFYTYACYWCAISILWLIFDVLMYVPLLVHRWLDKGAIE